jgi:hypothetical protein
MASGSPRQGMRSWIIGVMLTTLVLRALVPVGFMLAPIDGRLSVVLCDSDASHVAHQSGHDHSGHHHTHLDPTCPYAQSAGPAPAPTLPVLATARIIGPPVLPTQSARLYVQFGPSRQQSPCGPPAFS